MKYNEEKKQGIFHSYTAFYMDQRGLTPSSLKRATGINRTTIIQICNGRRPGKHLYKLAEALCVDPDDLKFCVDPLKIQKTAVNIKEITRQLLAAFSQLYPLFQRKKADLISAWLLSDESIEDFPDHLDDYVRYLALDSNQLGRNLLSLSIPEPSAQALPAPNFKQQKNPASESTTALEHYRRQRQEEQRQMQMPASFYISSLADKAHMTRQTMSRLLKGTQKPTNKQLWTFASILRVSYSDLSRDLNPDSSAAEPMVNIQREKDKLLYAIAHCKPKRLKYRFGILLQYLRCQDNEMEQCLEYLLFSRPSDETDFIITLNNLMKQPFSNEALYMPSIEIGYCQTENQNNEYEAYVLFEDWFYQIFQIESPLYKLPVPDSIDRTGLPEYGINFPICFFTDLSPRDNPEDFQSELVGQVMEYLLNYETAFMYPRLAAIFEDYLDTYLYDAEIQEFATDLELTRSLSIRHKESLYRQFLSKKWEESMDSSEFIDKLAKDLGRMDADPEYKQKIFRLL